MRKTKKQIEELDNVLSEQIKDKWEQQEKLQRQIDQIKESLSDVAYSLSKGVDEIKKRLEKLENKS